MDPTEGCLAGGENYREEGLPPPAPLPPTRREFCLVSPCSHRGSCLKEEYRRVTLRRIIGRPHKHTWTARAALCFPLSVVRQVLAVLDDQHTFIADEEKPSVKTVSRI